MRLGVDPVTAYEAGSSVLDLIGGWFSRIGAGRREADAIVPTQNELGDYLTAVDNELRKPLSVSDLQTLYAQLQQVWEGFLEFIYAPEFTQDGDQRASDGARRTMEWQVNDRLRQISERLIAAGSRVEAPVITQNTASSIATLQPYQPGSPYFPQSGTLPPVNTYPRPVFPSRTVEEPFVLSPSIALAVAAVGAWLLLGRR